MYLWGHVEGRGRGERWNGWGVWRVTNSPLPLLCEGSACCTSPRSHSVCKHTKSAQIAAFKRGTTGHLIPTYILCKCTVILIFFQSTLIMGSFKKKHFLKLSFCQFKTFMLLYVLFNLSVTLKKQNKKKRIFRKLTSNYFNWLIVFVNWVVPFFTSLTFYSPKNWQRIDNEKNTWLQLFLLDLFNDCNVVFESTFLSLCRKSKGWNILVGN